MVRPFAPFTSCGGGFNRAGSTQHLSRYGAKCRYSRAWTCPRRAGFESQPRESMAEGNAGGDVADARTSRRPRRGALPSVRGGFSLGFSRRRRVARITAVPVLVCSPSCPPPGWSTRTLVEGLMRQVKVRERLWQRQCYRASALRHGEGMPRVWGESVNVTSVGSILTWGFRIINRPFRGCPRGSEDSSPVSRRWWGLGGGGRAMYGWRYSWPKTQAYPGKPG